jgi:hypothetical protein
MGYKGVCGIKIDMVLRLIQEARNEKGKKHPSSIIKNKRKVVVC